MTYFDTSYLVRLYFRDQGFDKVRSLAVREGVIHCALHGRAELATALHRKFRECLLSRSQAAEVMIQVKMDCEQGGIIWLPLTEGVFRRLETALENAPQDAFVRAADALHLACAAEHGFQTVYSNDRRFLTMAPFFGLQARDILS